MSTENKTKKNGEQSPKNAKKQRKYIPVLMGSIGVIMVIGASFALLDRWQATMPVTDASYIVSFDTIVTEDTDDPDENKPDVGAVVYEVPADMPRRIIIPELGVNGFVQQVGVTLENAIAVPTNIHIAGWFVDSVKPGEEGLSIIDGHVSGRFSDGIFKELKSASPGTQFQIEFGDRSLKSFEVVEIRQLPEEESSAFLFERDATIAGQLNLITCGGNFDSGNQQFADRIIAVTKAM